QSRDDEYEDDPGTMIECKADCDDDCRGVAEDLVRFRADLACKLVELGQSDQPRKQRERGEDVWPRAPDGQQEYRQANNRSENSCHAEAKCCSRSTSHRRQSVSRSEEALRRRSDARASDTR